MQKPLLSLFYTVIFMLCVHTAFSQKFDLSGTVSDTTDTPLMSASVVLLSETDSTLVSFGIANAEGQFKLDGIKKGSYILQIIYLGYEQFYQNVNMDSDKDLGILRLTSALNKTDEVIIRADRNPMAMNKDTIVYNADAFQTQPNEMVEDLLKKLPGIEVEDDGSIKAQGEEVEQVLVDGKEFFGDDATIATRNLPAKAVDKVEVYDKKSDQAEFSGIDDGEREKTINLELKEDAKKGYFGQLSAGYGTDERYEGRASVNRFSKGLQMSLVGNLNNINSQGFSVDEYMNFMGGIGSFMGGGRMRFGGGGISINRGLSDGFVNTAAVGLNLNYDFSTKAEISLNYFINNIENEVDRTSVREVFNRNSSFFENEASLQISDNTNHRINTEFKLEMDSTQDITIRGSLGLNDASLLSNSNGNVETLEKVVENQSTTSYDSGGDNVTYSGVLTYRKKFGKKKKKIFTLNGTINSADDESGGLLDSENIYFPDDPLMTFSELIAQNQLQTNDQLDYSIRGTYTQALSKDEFLEFNYRRQNFNNELIKDVYDIVSGQEEFNDELSNHFERNYVYDRIGTSLTFNKEKYSLTTEVAFQLSDLYGDIISDGTVIEKNYKHILPRLNFRYEFGQSKNLSFRYQTSVREPSLEQLQPYTDNTDPLNIYQGNPELRPEYRHTFRINLFNYDQFSFRSFFAFINATYTNNSITNQTTIDSRFVQTTMPINVDNNFSINGNFSYGSPIKLFKTRINLNLGLGYNRNILFINSIENLSNRYNTNVQVRIENRRKDNFDISIGTRLSYNTTNYSVDSDNNQDFINQKYFGDFTYNLTDKSSISTSLDYDIYSSEGFEEAQKVPFWKASFSYYLLKNKKLEFKASAFDLLNKNIGINRSSNLNFTEYEQIQSIGRYFMFSLTYALSGLSGNSSGFRGGIRMMRGG